MAKAKKAKVEDFRSMDDQALVSRIQDDEMAMKKITLQPCGKSYREPAFYSPDAPYHSSYED